MNWDQQHVSITVFGDPHLFVFPQIFPWCPMEAITEIQLNYYHFHSNTGPRLKSIERFTISSSNYEIPFVWDTTSSLLFPCFVCLVYYPVVGLVFAWHRFERWMTVRLIELTVLLHDATRKYKRVLNNRYHAASATASANRFLGKEGRVKSFHRVHHHI